ncbi:MAG: YigZ family protein, partial [Prevotellaceae bacterium]|nr:YigZ family protein [Prevotellaceae bacterium]
MNTDNYKTIVAPATGLFKDKGSKFLAFAWPVDDEAQVKAHVQRLKKDYFDARHHCFAYRIGLNGEQWRANDDGEPSSTGGKPILGQLLSRELTHTLVVVVRYFGGVLLGVPGLINAYRSAAAD